MKLSARFSKFFDLDGRFPDHEYNRDHFLVSESNKVHRGLIKIEAFFGLLFTIITLFQGYYYQTILNISLFTFSCIAWLIQIRGHALLAKLFNLVQLILILALMFYFPASPQGIHVNDSVLAFYIPVSVGTLIAFQGKERNYGYLLSAFILIVVLTLIITDAHYPSLLPENKQHGLDSDLLYNICGAALATFAEVAYILALNNRLNSSLIKTNHELDNFVYIISHDLRSPLLSTKGLLDLATKKKSNPGEHNRYLELAGKSIGNLDEIIREILSYSRNTRTGLNKEILNVRDLINEIFNGLQFSTAPGFSFRSEIEGDPVIWCDKTRLNTVLRNIISNSVKYRNNTIPDPYVNVRFENTGKDIIIKITDNGEGIPKDAVSHVFEMFYRGTSTGQGTGLGLYICKEMLAKMNARFSLESEEGKGAEFTIQINGTSLPSGHEKKEAAVTDLS